MYIAQRNFLSMSSTKIDGQEAVANLGTPATALGWACEP